MTITFTLVSTALEVGSDVWSDHTRPQDSEPVMIYAYVGISVVGSLLIEV